MVMIFGCIQLRKIPLNNWLDWTCNFTRSTVALPVCTASPEGRLCAAGWWPPLPLETSPLSAPAVLCRPPADATARTKNEQFLCTGSSIIIGPTIWSVSHVVRDPHVVASSTGVPASRSLCPTSSNNSSTVLHIIAGQPLCSCTLKKETEK
jgi:hypothetical protein